MMKIYRALTGLVWLNQFARGTLSPSACACVCVCVCVGVCVCLCTRTTHAPQPARGQEGFGGLHRLQRGAPHLATKPPRRSTGSASWMDLPPLRCGSDAFGDGGWGMCNWEAFFGGD